MVGGVEPARHLTAVTDRRSLITSGVTLGAAVGVFGAVFGVGAVAAGGSVAQVCVMSLLVFTGASQFTAVSVVASGGSIGSAVGAGLILAARNGVYGLAMARVIRGSLARRLVAAHVTIDETTAMATAQPTPDAQRAAFWIVGASVFTLWNLGTLLGALAGSAVDPQQFGLDAAFPAGFVAMVAPHLRHRSGQLAAVGGAVICLVLIPFLPIGVPILCATVAVLVGVRHDDATPEPASAVPA